MVCRLLAAFCVLIITVTYSEAKTKSVLVIRNDDGGLIETYNKKFSRLEQKGTKVVIDGACRSACTRFMKLRNVCATDRAYFYFHAATTEDDIVVPEYSREDSRLFDLPEAFILQEKYDVFNFGIVKKPEAEKVYLEPDVERVYSPTGKGKNSPFQVWLKVKATKFIRPC